MHVQGADKEKCNLIFTIVFYFAFLYLELIKWNLNVNRSLKYLQNMSKNSFE